MSELVFPPDANADETADAKWTAQIALELVDLIGNDKFDTEQVAARIFEIPPADASMGIVPKTLTAWELITGESDTFQSFVDGDKIKALVKKVRHDGFKGPIGAIMAHSHPAQFGLHFLIPSPADVQVTLGMHEEWPQAFGLELLDAYIVSGNAVTSLRAIHEAMVNGERWFKLDHLSLGDVLKYATKHAKK